MLNGPIGSFVELLRANQLLPAARLAELAVLQPGCDLPDSLAQELVRRGWLTAYQSDCLLQGRAADLVLGPYRIVVHLSRYSDGTVGARHIRLGREAAIKVPQSDPQANGEGGQRLQREARALAACDHPHVVALYGLHELAGKLCLIMEYVEGPTLGRLLKERAPLPVPQVCAYVRQAALGVQQLHEKGVIHANVNPGNLLLSEAEGVIKVIGLAACRFMRPDKTALDDGDSAAAIGYLAPEWIEHPEKADARVDLYSMGCTLFELLAGQLPFKTGSTAELVRAHCEAKPPPIESIRPDVPTGLAAIVRRLLAKKPGDRFPTAAALAEALARFGADSSPVGALGHQTTIGPYTILEQMQETGMSRVFKAIDPRLDRSVVIKVMHENVVKERPADVAQFYREGQALARLHHPNIVRLYDADELAGRPYLVLEFVEGPTLEHLVKNRGPLPVGRACEYVRQAAQALGHAHAQGVIHRDVTPANMIATADAATIKLLDLGLAKLPAPSDDAVADHDPRQTGKWFGTPAFVAPEQMTDFVNADGRSDLYSLGCVLYFLLTGEFPFPGKKLQDQMLGHLQQPPRRIEELRRDIPREVAALVHKLLAKAPGERSPSAVALADALAPLSSLDEPLGTQVHPAPASVRGAVGSGVATPPAQPGPVSSPSATGAAETPEIGGTVTAPAPPVASVAPPRPVQPPVSEIRTACEAVPSKVRPRLDEPPAFPRQSFLGRLLQRLKNRLGRWGQRWRESRSREAVTRDLVDCTIFAPPVAVPGETLFIQVFAHRPEQAEAASQLAQEFDAAAQRRAFKSLHAEVAIGAELTFHLTMPGLTIEKPMETLIWRGRAESVQFAATVPRGRPAGTLVGSVTVSLASVPIGHIQFKLAVGTTATRDTAPIPIGDAAPCYRKAFISYASKDRAEVLKRVQMLAPLQIKFFQDVLDLEPGDRWEQKLYRHIDDSDLFLLFWSSAAKESNWVQEEVRYALKRQAGDTGAAPRIFPVILEGPPPPLPPPELNHLHFNDYVLYFMNALAK